MILIEPLFDVLRNFGTGPEIALIAAIFALGGFTKGAIGFGLPTIAVPLLANFMPVPIAISISLLAIVLSNAYQMVVVGSPIQSLKRFWPLLLSLGVTLSLTTQILVSLTAASLLIAAGSIIVLVVGLQLTGYHIKIPTIHEKSTGAGIGVLAGIMGGITSLFSMPIIIFLTSMRLNKDEFISAISLILFTGISVMAVVLTRYSVLGKTEFLLSVYALLPLTIGYVLGAKLRHILNQEAFLRLVLIFLLCNGFWLVFKGLNG